MEGILDTSSAQSMIDTVTVKLMGLQVEVARKYHYFSLFLGLNSEPVRYYSRVLGLVSVQLGPQVILTLPELKVIQHVEPLLILEGDLMATPVLGDWSFLYVGINPKDRGGEVAFIHGIEVAKVPLVCCL